MNKNLKYILYSIVLFISISTIWYYGFERLTQSLIYSKEYKNLPKKEIIEKEQELEHNLANFKKNLNNYIIIKDYLVTNNDINYITKEWIHDNFVITKDWFKNKIICWNDNTDILCKINWWEKILDFFNNLELNWVSKYYLQKDVNIWENIQYESEKWYIISFINNVLKSEIRLYDSYIYYEKWWEVFYDKNTIKNLNGYKIIELPNQIITIYDDNWIIKNYINKYNFE